ncbi:MAG: PKD domain-containing protein [Thermoplasmata archaeon]|nr:MAG: PKD domain-containing protein [Thermoplasmata archaeon]
MKIKITLAVFALLFIAINPSPLPIAKADSFDGLSWEKYADENGAIPVLEEGEIDDMDHPWVCGPGVLRDDDVLLDDDPTNDDELYKMWYSGNTIKQYYNFRLFYATSHNGVIWHKYVDASGSAIPVIDLGGAPDGGDDASAYSPCVLKEEGVYKMWYSGQHLTTSPYKTLYATSLDGIQWTKYGIVLNTGAPGERDERDAYAPDVIIDKSALPSERYKMWYTGQTPSGPFKIFYATSDNGIDWTKYSDSGGAIPVFEPGGAPGGLDDSSVSHQSVLKDNDGLYRMWYNGASSIGIRILYANSTDGINWDKYGLAIVVGDTGEKDHAVVGGPYILKDDDERYKMWYNGGDGEYVKIFLAFGASPENLPPVAEAGIDKFVFEGDYIQVNGSYSYDLDGTIVSYQWDFDASDGLCWELGYPPDAMGKTPIHTYSDIGVYIATLNVTDNNGSSDTDSCLITILKVPELNINVSLDRKDVILYWDPPSNSGIKYYLIYRSISQTSFDFNDIWVNTSTHYETDELGPIPLRTMWNDTNAADPEDISNYNEQYYYTMRAMNIVGKTSRNCRTVGKWTKIFPQGVSTFSLPLEPLQLITVDYCLSEMDASYIKWMDPVTHIWNIHESSLENDALMTVGDGYEVEFDSETVYTFTGMPGAMIYHINDTEFKGFDPSASAKSLKVTVNQDRSVDISWLAPANMNFGDWYEVYCSYTREGFFGSLGANYFPVGPVVNYGDNETTHVDANANDPGARLYYIVVPYSASGIRGSSTYSIGIWTEDYRCGYDTLGIPLKMKNDYTADWMCDNIPDTEGINYFDNARQKWYWHSAIMPVGAFDTTLKMTEGYQISTTDFTVYTYIGV